jgi:hypothetical protein
MQEQPLQQLHCPENKTLDTSMSEVTENYIIGPPGNDDFVFARPMIIRVLCVHCNDVVEGKLHNGWGVAEHFPIKKWASALGITECANCRNQQHNKSGHRVYQLDRAYNMTVDQVKNLDIFNAICKLKGDPTELSVWSSTGVDVPAVIRPVILTELMNLEYEMTYVLSNDQTKIGKPCNSFLLSN